MKSYLSVDLDYWGMKDYGFKNSVTIFINKIIELNKSIHVYNSHESILDDLNRRKVDHLYQIDFHSDICEDGDNVPFNEGTWANFYKYRKKCIFEWRYPSTETCFNHGMGRCDSSQDDGYKAYWPKDEFPYKKIIRKQGLSNINWESISAIGFAISRNWWIHKGIDFIFEKYDFLNHPED